MPPRFKEFLGRWLITTAAVMVAANLGLGVHCDNFTTLLVASLLLGILNAFLRPLLVLLALPLVIFTLGFFFFVINALLLYLVGALVKGFHVDSFWAAFCGALVITIVTLLLNSLTGSGGARFKIHRGAPPPARRDDDDGPVIDV
jgi:putative membrane protein